MTISELEKKLASIRAQVGDVVVEVRNPAGEADHAATAELVNVSRIRGEVKWHAFIDT